MSCGTVTQGAKTQWMPVARTSSAVICADFFDQRGVAGCAQADVVREDDVRPNVVVAVDGVDAVEQRDFAGGFFGRVLGWWRRDPTTLRG